MNKPHIVKRSIIAAILICLGYLILGTTLPFVSHKEVTEVFVKEVEELEILSDEPGTERAAFVKDNTQALIYRLQMMEDAKQEIILSTFDFNADDAGKDIMAALIHAADRNIKVKVMIDGFSGFLDVNGDEWFLALTSHENIEVKIYNPIQLWKPWAIQTRLHDKYLIIDDKMYLLGGRNNTNIFLGDYQEHKNIDRELFLYETEPQQGNSLQQVRDYFEQIWSLPESQEFVCEQETEKVRAAYEQLEERWLTLQERYPQGFIIPDWTEVTFPVNKVTLLTNPIEAKNKEPELWYTLQELMKDGEKVWIHTPYIICSDEMYKDLTQICEKASSVEVITNAVVSGANPWGCCDYLNERENILETGVTVHEFLGEMSNHTKTILIDDRVSIVGSYNLDMRSTYLDTEMMLAVDSQELNRILQEEAREQMEYCRSISKGQDYHYAEYYEHRDFTPTKKVIYDIMRILIKPIRYLL